MEVLELQEQDKLQWDAYVYGSAQATVFHLAAWKDVMQDTFGLQPHYLFVTESGQVLGVLPLLHVKSKLSGNFFTSMPGAICARDDETARVLVERAKELVKASRADYFILRDSHRKWNLPELVTNEDHCTLIVKLFEDPKKVWDHIKRRARQLANKALKAELKVVNGQDSLDDFYPVFSRAMRDRGTPTLGLKFFCNVAARFPTHFDLLTVHRDGETLGGGCIAPFKDTVYCTWGGMLRQFYELNPNHLLFWETLKFGCENGFQQVDLGRSQWNSGAFVFKKNWGAEPRALYQQFYLNSCSSPPNVGSGMQASAQYRLFVKAWRRLPLPVTEVLGPWLRKRMPFG